MEKAEVQKLAHLARIAVTDDEAETLTSEIDAILAYVGAVSEVAGVTSETPHVGPVYNVLREDVVTNDPGQYSEALMAAMPETDGRFMKVKKILQQDD